MDKATPKYKVEFAKKTYLVTKENEYVCSSVYLNSANLVANSLNRDHLFDELVQKLDEILRYHSMTFSSQTRSDIRDLLQKAKAAK